MSNLEKHAEFELRRAGLFDNYDIDAGDDRKIRTSAEPGSRTAM